ncbi:sensor domain-containing diguanylate cyclase [Thioalkalivibrio sp. XN279]|uniref:sensor domain-containing diguanylate cyclase n=1 Tax=Thioalkalivibrio sp. XN279 TaxID=2714953 RepID=UPI001408760C|nr:sensor domain-containing diguanylate cyclase [Thioalkalivibrio sp. XN279]NHA15591.1 diguanylate cyclase [Thioalkalivibrio sp. XN279]
MMKRVLTVFLPLAIVFLAAFWYLQDTTVRSKRNIVEASEARIVALQAQTAARALQDLATDLQVLANGPALHRYLLRRDSEALRRLEMEFLNFSGHKKRYDQIRLLDLHGMEIVRVNFSRDGRAEIVPGEQLQPKGGRYYFAESINLAPGQIFISPLDLNIEHGAIEEPLKPMIRLGMPVVDEMGRKRGVVILNYLAQYLIDAVESSGSELLGDFSLLNSEGYWLASVKRDQEWGFMYPERSHMTFKAAFPEAWELMQVTDSGQFQSPKGLFTFTKVLPRVTGRQSERKDSSDIPRDPSLALATQQHRWRIVSHVSSAALWHQVASPLSSMIATLLGGLSVLGALAFGVAKAHARVAKEHEGRLRNIEVLRKNQTELMNQLHFNQTLIDSIPAPVFFKDTEGRYLGCNKAFEAFIGKTAEQLIGKSVSDLAPRDLASVYFKQDQELFDNPGQQVYESSVVYADGSRHEVVFYKHTFTNHHGEMGGLIGVMLDITDRKRMEEQIRHMAQHDALTGLPNRNLLEDRYRQCVHRAQREQSSFAILMMDLDGFKGVNDTLGHKIGDLLLRQVAKRLAQSMRKTDTLCRIGGDEFVALLEEVQEQENIIRVAEAILETLGKPFILGPEQTARIGVSIGVVVSRTYDEALDTLLTRADMAMYRAKRDGRNRYEFFDLESRWMPDRCARNGEFVRPGTDEC